MTDEEFIAAFEDGTLPNEAFHHRDHLRLAWLYLDRAPFEQAAARIEQSIRRFAAQHGASQKYHHTLTILWMRLVALHRAETPYVIRFDTFLVAHAGLLDKDLPLRHYSPTRLHSEPARTGWIEPDVRPLPPMVGHSTETPDSSPLPLKTIADKR